MKRSTKEHNVIKWTWCAMSLINGEQMKTNVWLNFWTMTTTADHWGSLHCKMDLSVWPVFGSLNRIVCDSELQLKLIVLSGLSANCIVCFDWVHPKSTKQHKFVTLCQFFNLQLTTNSAPSANKTEWHSPQTFWSNNEICSMGPVSIILSHSRCVQNRPPLVMLSMLIAQE